LEFDLSLTGFDTKELDDLLLNDAPDEDHVPPVPDQPVSGGSGIHRRSNRSRVHELRGMPVASH
jgi:hypothetical protein